MFGLFSEFSRRLGVVVAFVLLAGLNAYGQNPNPTPSADPNAAELQRLKDELEVLKQISALRKEIAQSEADKTAQEKNKILNALPQPTSTPLVGSVTITNFTFENEILAYRALGEIAHKIVARLDVPARPNLIFYNEADLRATETYLVLLSQMQGYNEAYKNHFPQVEIAMESALLGPQVASSFLRSVADLLALFRTDVKTEGLTIGIDEQAMIARFSAALSDKFEIYDPSLLLPNTLQSAKLSSPVLEELNALQHYRMLADEMTISDQSTKQQLAALNKEVDKFLTALLQIDPQTKRSPLVGLFRAEKILSLRPAQGTNGPPLYFLYVKIVKTGGSHNTKTNLFKGTKITETGGVILAYSLISATGQIASSGTCYGFLRARSAYAESPDSIINCN